MRTLAFVLLFVACTSVFAGYGIVASHRFERRRRRTQAHREMTDALTCSERAMGERLLPVVSRMAAAASEAPGRES